MSVSVNRKIRTILRWFSKVVTVDIPLTSLDEDVAVTEKTIWQQTAPVLLVGHSYGGTGITEAGDDPKIAGLVYVAA